MAQGRGNANKVMVVGVALLCLAALAQETLAATYTVGGTSGWTNSMANWSKPSIFRVGDVLVFKYNKRFHNVAKVNKAAYKSCVIPRGTTVYKTGSDKFRLRKGTNYFVCAAPGHCQTGMKFAVRAL